MNFKQKVITDPKILGITRVKWETFTPEGVVGSETDETAESRTQQAASLKERVDYAIRSFQQELGIVTRACIDALKPDAAASTASRPSRSTSQSASIPSHAPSSVQQTIPASRTGPSVHV